MTATLEAFSPQTPRRMTFAEQLKSQLNIVDVVGQYVRLKRQSSGARYVGLCPFHSEKTPSFNVNSNLQIYKCFGCDAAGDVFKFVMEHDGLTFPEALKTLAERYGIPMPQRDFSDDPEARTRAALFEMHEIAADLFQKNLRGPGGADARRYLESRGVSKEAMDEFRLGLSDLGGQQLADRLQKFSPALLEQSGLVLRRDNGTFFDRFRGRLMFPIHNESGKLIAFGGRALRAQDEPKYLNSPETKLYKKSAVLYNLHRAKMDARKNDRMILVEGYMDVIGVYSAEIHEVVASSGTSLGSDQVRAIKRQVSQQGNAGQIILNFDPDAAGARSTEKYIGILLAEGLRVKILQIPGGDDPDEYIQQHGADAYRRLMDAAPTYFHWLADRAKQKFDIRTAEGRVDAFNFLLPVLQQVHHPVERAAIATEIAESLQLERDVVNAALRRTSAAPPQRPKDLSSALAPNERLLLACLLTNKEARQAITQYLRKIDMLPVLEMRAVFAAAVATEDEGLPFSVEALSSRVDERARKIISELSFADLGMPEDGALQQALHCLEALEKKADNTRSDQLKQQIREAERAGNLEEAMRLADELNRSSRPPEGQNRVVI
ncbi:MAG TPA: DNA primase [Bryobacteraceae bacterium]|nr:DNA primase [Bryobacteraceae bacterium]